MLQIKIVAFEFYSLVCTGMKKCGLIVSLIWHTVLTASGFSVCHHQHLFLVMAMRHKQNYQFKGFLATLFSFNTFFVMAMRDRQNYTSDSFNNII